MKCSWRTSAWNEFCTAKGVHGFASAVWGFWCACHGTNSGAASKGAIFALEDMPGDVGRDV